MNKPVIDFPPGEAPSDLQVIDLVEGDGNQVRNDSFVRVHYVGACWSNHREFDSSWERHEPFQFRVGAGQVIKGWEKGLLGARVGGRRQIIIPPELGYGDRGAGDDIAPGETLVFVCDIVRVINLTYS